MARSLALFVQNAWPLLRVVSFRLGVSDHSKYGQRGRKENVAQYYVALQRR